MTSPCTALIHTSCSAADRPSSCRRRLAINTHTHASVRTRSSGHWSPGQWFRSGRVTGYCDRPSGLSQWPVTRPDLNHWPGAGHGSVWQTQWSVTVTHDPTRPKSLTRWPCDPVPTVWPGFRSFCTRFSVAFGEYATLESVFYLWHTHTRSKAGVTASRWSN